MRVVKRPDLKAVFSAVSTLLLLATPAFAQSEPGADWPRTTPQAAGWSPVLMAQAHSYAQGIGTANLLVVYHGQIIDSLGDISQRRELHSMRKSLLSALIGIDVAERRIDLNATLAQLGIDDVPPSLTPDEKQATVADLLASRSGVYHVALYETGGNAATVRREAATRMARSGTTTTGTSTPSARSTSMPSGNRSLPASDPHRAATRHAGLPPR